MTKIKMSDIDLEITEGSSMYVQIDIFKFTRDISKPFVEVEMEVNGEFEYFSDIQVKSSELDKASLKIMAINWIFNNVELVREF